MIEVWYCALLCSEDLFVNFFSLQSSHCYSVSMTVLILCSGAGDDDIPPPVWPHQQPDEELLSGDYYLTAEGKNTSHRVIAVIAHLSPHITYCPAMLPVVDLFLHYMDAPQCFSCVMSLLRCTAPVYLTQSRIAFKTTSLVLQDLTVLYAVSMPLKSYSDLIGFVGFIALACV